MFFSSLLGKGKPWSIENFIFSTSDFYQREFDKLGFSKPHLIFPRDISNIKKFIKIIFSLEFKNFNRRFVFLKYSFISFLKIKFILKCLKPLIKIVKKYLLTNS